MRIATSGSSGRPSRRRSSANASAAGGKTFSGSHVPVGEDASVPAPISTTSAKARSMPMTKRSPALSAATRALERGIDGIATTPSIVETKLA